MTTVTRAWLLFGALSLPFGGGAHRKTEEGNQSYLDGEYDEALRAYTEAQVRAPQAAELYYDIGNVLYRQGDYQGAAEAYTRALLEGHPPLESAAAFNLGNAHYRLEQYDDAISSYERALRLAPQDADAKRNLELALKAREAQQQQQQDQQGPQDKDKQKDAAEDPQQGQGGQPETGEEPSKPSGSDDQQQQKPGERQDEQRSGQAGQERQEGEEGQGAAARPGEMNPEDAARLLDSLEEQELDNLRQRLLERRARRAHGTEKDW